MLTACIHACVVHHSLRTLCNVASQSVTPDLSRIRATRCCCTASCALHRRVPLILRRSERESVCVCCTRVARFGPSRLRISGKQYVGARRLETCPRKEERKEKDSTSLTVVPISLTLSLIYSLCSFPNLFSHNNNAREIPTGEPRFPRLTREIRSPMRNCVSYRSAKNTKKHVAQISRVARSRSTNRHARYHFHSSDCA